MKRNCSSYSIAITSNFYILLGWYGFWASFDPIPYQISMLLTQKSADLVVIREISRQNLEFFAMPTRKSDLTALSLQKFLGNNLTEALKQKRLPLTAQDYADLKDELDKNPQLKRLVTLLHLKPVKVEQAP